MATHWRQSGFTLLELIVVLLIMTVMLSVTAPRLAGRGQDASLRAAGHEMQSLATAARARAVLYNQNVGMILSAEGREMRLISKEDAQDDSTVIDLLPLRRFPETIHAEFQPEKGGDPNLIRFRPDGSVDGGEIRVIDSRGGELLLRLVQPLGQLRLGGCPRLETIAREVHFESDFSIV